MTSLPQPMLAAAGSATDVTDEQGWAFEMKWDGIRLLATVDGADVTLTTRNGHDVSDTYPEIVEALGLQGLRDTVLDGEVVALGPTGAPDFGLLQSRSGLTRSRDVAAARRVRVSFLAFDLLRLDGTTVTGAPYTDRRAALLALELDDGPVRVPPAFDGRLSDAIASSRELGLEGVMAKRRDSRYVTGRRSSAWVKIKHVRTQEVVVGGWRPGQGGRTGDIGSLLVGVPEGDTLRYVGRVGSGLADRVRAELQGLLTARSECPFQDVPRDVARDAHWVAPVVVGEVAFAEWTSSGQLRQPRWRGIRRDKAAADVHVEDAG